MFMLVSRRHERASLIVTSNKPFSAWGEIFGDDVVAAAMIDRLVHHAEILALKATPTASKTATSPDTPSASDARGERRSGLARRARLHAARHGPPGGPLFDRRYRPTFRPALTSGSTDQLLVSTMVIRRAERAAGCRPS